MDQLVSDRQVVFLSVASFAGVYCVLSLLTPANSQVPLLAAVFVASNMFSRSQAFRRSVMALQQWYQRIPRRGFHFVGSGDPDRFFSGEASPTADSALLDSSKSELVSALRSLDAYQVNSKNYNERRRKLFKMMLWRQQKLCEEVGYSKKLKKIDAHITKNQAVFNQIIEVTKARYGFSYRDFGVQRAPTQNTSSSNYRVVEALGHFVRDWSAVGATEINPMLDYIRDHLDKIVPAEEAQDTCVVLPGSGLGRVAHEVALHRDYGAVYAVEFSGLMHACHRFLYEKLKGPDDTVYSETHTLSPYIHTCSNFTKTESQFRLVEIPNGVQKPENLHVILDDFRYFSIPEDRKFKNVVVVSVFFMDTAENLIDYIDVINQLTTPLTRSSVKNGYWINVGPLKYGTAAQVELNASEFAQVRKKIGWNDLNTLNTLEEPSSKYCHDGVLGYITDKESLWQGYYGLSMWTSAQKENQRTCK